MFFWKCSAGITSFLGKVVKIKFSGWLSWLSYWNWDQRDFNFYQLVSIRCFSESPKLMHTIHSAEVAITWFWKWTLRRTYWASDQHYFKLEPTRHNTKSFPVTGQCWDDYSFMFNRDKVYKLATTMAIFNIQSAQLYFDPKDHITGNLMNSSCQYNFLSGEAEVTIFHGWPYWTSEHHNFDFVTKHKI